MADLATHKIVTCPQMRVVQGVHISQLNIFHLLIQMGVLLLNLDVSLSFHSGCLSVIYESSLGRSLEQVLAH